MKQIKDTMLNVRVTKELAKKFKIMCLLNDQKQSAVIQELLESYIESYSNRILNNQELNERKRSQI